MQIIISPVAHGFENFLLEVDSHCPVGELRGLIATRLKVDKQVVKMVCEGSSLEDGATLGDFYVGNLSTIRVALANPSKEMQGKDASDKGEVSVRTSAPTSMFASVALSPLGTAPAPMLSPPAVLPTAPSVQDETVISEDEGKRAIIVTGIPAADPTRTEVALVEAFSKFGVLSRVIFQDERNAAAEGVTSPVHQRAVVLFEQEGDALAAVNSEVPVMVLGCVPESIIPASALQLPNAGGVTRSTTQHHALTGPSQAVAHMLAQGFLYGHKGVAHVKAFDDTHGMSQRIRVALDTITSKAGELDDRYHIAQTVRSTYEAAAAQAADLDRELHISEQLTQASQYALARASEWAAVAMRNPTIAATVASARDVLSQAAASLQDTYQQARAEVRDAQSRSTAQRSAAGTTSSVAVPPPGAH